MLPQHLLMKQFPAGEEDVYHFQIKSRSNFLKEQCIVEDTSLVSEIS